MIDDAWSAHGRSIACVREGVARTMKVEMGKRISRVAKRSTSAVAFQFGGSKESGYGRECCEPGIHEFVNAKEVRVLQ